MVAPEKGLASLITQRQAHASTPANNSQCIQYIFADPDLQACQDNGEINYKELSIAVQHKVQELAASQPSSSAGVSTSASQPGRLGPKDVTIDKASVCGSFRYSNDGYTVESLGNFSSCRANVACFKGKWQYECTVLTPGIQQIGWATIHCPFTAEEGVGDAPDSYAVDGKRVRKWSVKPQEYGEPWVQGDVIGCLLDLDSEPGTITFYRNGQSLGVAYSKEQLLDQPYLVRFALLPVLSELQKLGGDHQRALQLLVHLLALVWDENSNAFSSIVSGLLEELAYRCQVSPLLAQDYPYTAAYPHLSLAVALLQHPAVLGVLTAHSNFPAVVEGLLARKAPSPKDLQQLLPHVWWRGCRDETASQERMRASISIITTTMAKKNRDALRDVPPPGLSEPTVLMSTFFVLLRMLQPALTAARDSGTGPLASFPAAQMFAGTGFAAETAAVFDAPRLGGGDAWVPELLNCCLLLYCWRVGFNYKMIQSLSSSVASSSSTLDELDRMIASYNEAGESVQALTWVSGTRKVYYDELVRDVRLLTLLRAAFFSPGKQAALCALSSYLATLLANISSLSPLPAPAAGVAAGSRNETDAAVVGSGSPEQRAVEDAAAAGQSNLLCYVPVVYVDVIVDYLTALRRCQEPSGTGQWVLQPQVTGSYVACVCSLLNDPRIANPDVQESLLQVVGALLDHPAWRVMVESNTERTRQLLSSLLVVFDSRLWHPASSVLMKVVRSCGFGYPDSCPASPNSLQQVLLDCINAAAPSAATAEAPSSSQAFAAAAHARGFLNRLFSTMNWCLTEFTVSVGDLHSLRGRRSILEAQNHYRRTGLMFELSVTFMRILEFVVVSCAD
eukprot:gene10985-11140_t